jgi:hypothetical protein
MTPLETIADIQKQFDSGKWIVEIRTKVPRKLRKRLYTLAHRRNYPWFFSTIEGSVFIVRSKATL